MVFFRLSEAFDRFEIDTLEERRQQNVKQSLRDRYRRSVSHSQNHSRGIGRKHERSRSHSSALHVQSHQNVRKSSVKDRLGTPVKKPVRHRLSPVPSTSQQQHNEQHSFNGDETQALDQIDGGGGGADSQETFDMSDIDSILNKCICKFSHAKFFVFVK